MIEPRDEELSRIYRDAEAPVPPQRVDDNILAASRRVAGVGPRPARGTFASRWGTPVALAATVVVTFTLALVAFEQRTGLETAVSGAPVPNKQANAVPAAEPKPAERADRPQKASVPVLRPIAPVPATATPAATASRDRAEPRTSGGVAARVPPAARRPAFVPEIPRTSEVLRKSEEAKPAAAPPAANSLPGERAVTDQLAPAPEAQRGPEVPRQAQPRAAAGATGPRESTSTLLRSGVAGGLANPLAAPEVKERTPEKWIEDIRRLRTEGKATEAERELNEFKKRYPDYRLPEDLR